MTAAVLKFVAMAELPNRIRELRKAKGWTQQELGERANCSYVQVSELERGDIELNLRWMVRFANALGVEPADLLLHQHNSSSLSPEERDLVECFRRGSPEQKAQLRQMAGIIIPPKAQAA